MSAREGAGPDSGTCVSGDCQNERNPHDWRGMCLTCNPLGDSLVMNNDPAYVAWAARTD